MKRKEMEIQAEEKEKMAVDWWKDEEIFYNGDERIGGEIVAKLVWNLVEAVVGDGVSEDGGEDGGVVGSPPVGLILTTPLLSW